MQPAKNCKVILRNYLLLEGSIDVRLQSENHHKINVTTGEDLPLNEGVVPPFVGHFLHHLIE